MDPDRLSAKEWAARLIAQHEPGGVHPSNDVAPVLDAIAQAVGELTRWVGTDGCRALVSRAMARAASDHPALPTIRLAPGSPIRLTGVPESVLAHGAQAAAAALNAVLIELFELLQRLIGADLTGRIVEPIMGGGKTGTKPEGNQE